MKKSFVIRNLMICIIGLALSCKTNNEYILIEHFNENRLGWVEEWTEFHHAEIDSGIYHLSSLDTSKSTLLSSTGPIDNSFLLGLPENFEINTNIKLIDHELEDTHYGLFLYGASLRYAFEIYRSGKIEVLEYDYNSGTEYLLVSADSEFPIENEVSLRIEVNGIKFKFYLDDYEIGRSEFRVKSWQELRLYTSKQSKIAIDHLIIKDISS